MDKILEIFPKGKDHIGWVLNKMTRSQADDLLEYWSVCGFENGLFEIAGDLEEVKYDNRYHESREKNKPGYLFEKNLKPEAQELFEFLETILN